jgi:osmotically-inducible protein OsmY
MDVLADGALAFKIKAALIADERIGGGGVHVDVTDGVATLTGSVRLEVQRDLAERIALGSGARHVVSRLEITEPGYEPPIGIIPEDAPRVTTSAGATPVSGDGPADAVRAALAADDRVNEHLIVVEVENGIARLTGRQDNDAARAAAIEIATHVPGILGIVNELNTLPSV